MIYFSLLLGVVMFTLSHLMVFKGTTKEYFTNRKKVISILLNLIAGFVFVISWVENPTMMEFAYLKEPSYIFSAVFGFVGFPVFKITVDAFTKLFEKFTAKK